MTNGERDNRRKALFIINPASGVLPVNFIVSKDLERRKKVLSSTRSMTKEETGPIIRDNFNSFDVFVAVGGDGTVHTVAEELVGKEKILAVLPLGSGNGFAREFGFRLNLNSLLGEINRAETMDVDVADLNGKLCLNVAGIGLDSFVAHSFNDLKLRGFLSYIALTFKTFWQLRPIPVTIIIGNEEVIEEELFVLTIANTRQFGNNAFIAPLARPTDGKIDLVLIRPFPKILGSLFILRLFTKRINQSKYVRHIQTDKEVIIKTNETRYHIDGEPVTFSGEINVKIRREALRVLKTPGNKFLAKVV